MTDYNDGNWHEWDECDCPVHHDSVVQIVYNNDHKEPNGLNVGAREMKAGDVAFGNQHIIAFRVVRAYREPREFWVADVGLGFMEATPETRGAFKVREVLE